MDERDAGIFLAAGNLGDSANYIDNLAFLNILRKVLLRVSTKTNYLVLKLH